MKKSTIITSIILTIAFLPATLAGTFSEDYKKVMNDLEEAVANKNFKDAKESLIVLMPLIKEDIKANKKEYSIAKKGKEQDEVKEIKQVLGRKNEIYDKLDHLIKSSPSAVRVRSKEVISLVEEYLELSLQV